MTDPRDSVTFAFSTVDGQSLTATISGVAISINGQGVFPPSLPPPPPPKPPAPALMLYSQRDPRWAKSVYAGDTTFAQAGCYVTSVAMLLSLAGYIDDPPTVAAALRQAGCFDGSYLTRPNHIPQAYPLVKYGGWVDWHKTHAELSVFGTALKRGPVIIEVDFRPTTKAFDQHFVLALQWDEERNDVLIADPWDGTRCWLIERYRLVWYAMSQEKPLESAICGMRLLWADGVGNWN